jgi:hypothetical protein
MSSANESGSTKGITIIAVVVALVIAAVSFFGYYNSVRSEGIGKENHLEGTYQANQDELSKVTLTVKETAGIANVANTKMDEIIKNAIQGRYDGAMDAGTGGAMFSAITEAYPELGANVALYARVQDAIIAGRQSFSNRQKLLLDEVVSYENWLEQDVLRSTVVKMAGFPSGSLEARIGDKVYTGREALTRIKTLVLTKDTTTAYETGEVAPLFGSETAK